MGKNVSADGILEQGKGIGSIVVGQSSKASVIEAFGEGFELTPLGEYSIEMNYEELGLAFYYLQDDLKEIVFSICAKHPFAGKTSKGIQIGQSSMQVVVGKYGKPNYWNADKDDKYTALYNGIRFRIERDTSLPRYPVDEEVHLPRKILEISIVEPY